MVDVLFGVEARYAKSFLHVLDSGGFEFIDPVVGVPSVLRFFGFSLQSLNDSGIGHCIRFADAHVEQFLAGIGFQCRPLGALDFFEFIYFSVLAELVSAQTVGKEILNITSGR